MGRRRTHTEFAELPDEEYRRAVGNKRSKAYYARKREDIVSPRMLKKVEDLRRLYESLSVSLSAKGIPLAFPPELRPVLPPAPAPAPALDAEPPAATA